jgi:hypothetical protein
MTELVAVALLSGFLYRYWRNRQERPLIVNTPIRPNHSDDWEEKELDKLRKIRERVDRLQPMVMHVLKYYDEVACPCSFPRFLQYASLKFEDFDDAMFYLIETEAFNDKARPYYNIQKTEQHFVDLWTCKKCRSTFHAHWDQFSINFDRTYLEPLRITAAKVGKDVLHPIPIFVGYFGFRTPDPKKFGYVELGELQQYLLALDDPS